MRSTSSRRSVLLYCLAVLALVTTGTWFGLGSGTTKASAASDSGVGTTFPGTGTGSIPDNMPAGPLVVSFNVTGLSGTASDVKVDMTATHSWLGDLTAVLKSPDGTTHTIFARPGYTGSGFGYNADLSGTYSFFDTAAGDLWAAASPQTIVPAGNYRTSAATTGAPTIMTAAFSSIPSLNGTWTLSVSDSAGGDTGAVTAANLTIATAAAPSGPANVDFDGDGTSDYTVGRDQTPLAARSSERANAFRFESIRDRLKYEAENPRTKGTDNGPALAAPPVGSNIGWWISNSGSATSTGAAFGEPMTDYFVPADYDGDGKTDIAVWRPITSGAPNENAFFYIFESETSTLTTVDFGQNGDDAAIVGDYDADGIADPAVYRCPAPGAGDGQCYFYFKGSNNNPGGNISAVPWGFGETFDFFVNPGDFDGDGKYDFCIQGTDPANAGGGLFYLLRSSDFGVEYVRWGRNTDIIVPGDYDGDGKADFAVSRTETIDAVPGRSYYILERDGGGTGASPIRWGIAGDSRAPGDYDGDGSTDIAIWRPNADPSMNYFYVLRSSDGMVGTFEWGQSGDVPVALWNVH
jgi:subtilisin-like proprotein convertase family protein